MAIGKSIEWLCMEDCHSVKLSRLLALTVLVLNGSLPVEAVGHKMGALARPRKFCLFPVNNFRLHESVSRCRSAKDQYASEEAHAITTTRLPVVIVYVRQSIIWQGRSLYSSPVPTNGGAPPDLVGPRPH